MGHLMRCITLAIEADRQGWGTTFIGDLAPQATALIDAKTPFAQYIVVDRASGATKLAAALDSVEADLIHIDSYWPESDAVANRAVAPISNMQDGPFGVRRATLAIDANLGAERWFERPEFSSHHLAGSTATVVRDQVLAQRAERVQPHDGTRVLVVLGGTDPHLVTPAVVRSLDVTTDVWDITVIAPPAVHDAVTAAASSSKHAIEVIDFTSELPALARCHDAVITAAGTSVWDFACMGLPMGLVCVTENQVLGYEAAVAAGLGIGLSTPPHGELAAGISRFDAAINDQSTLNDLSNRGKDLVDGHGAWRIVSAWSALNASSESTSNVSTFIARTATMADAEQLFAWRNDPVTRGSSRSTEPLVWEDHIAWLTKVLATPSRILLVVEESGAAVGTVRWDDEGGIDWEVSISLAPACRGLGVGRAVLEAGENAFLRERSAARLLASIHADNVASARLFQRAGYIPHLPRDEFGFQVLAKLSLPPRKASLGRGIE